MSDRDLQLRQLEELARRALRAFGLEGGPAAPELTLLEHKANTTYRVRVARADGDRDYLLRLGAPGRYPPEVVASELRWLDACRRAGLPVQEPVQRPVRPDVDAMAAEAWVYVEDERCCTLTHWLPGRPLTAGAALETVATVEQTAEQTAEQTGELLARLHRVAEGFTPPPGFVRPKWTLERLLGPGAAEGNVVPVTVLAAGAVDLLPPSAQALLARAASEVRAAVADLEGQKTSGAAVWGLIHTDFEPDNLIVRSGQIVRSGHIVRSERKAETGELAAIDFEHCGFGYYLYDLGGALLALADRPDFPALRRALLDGYQRQRPLPPAQARHLDAFLLLRALYALRLLLIDSWHLPGTQDDAPRVVPYLLGGIRRTLQAIEASGSDDSLVAPAGAAGETLADDLAALSTVQFLGRLRRAGVQLRAEGEQLRFSAPKGALTPALREQLVARKPEVLTFLQQAAGSDDRLPPIEPRTWAVDGAVDGAEPPLSYAQQRMWFLDRLDPGSAAYNTPMALRVEGEVRLAALLATLDEIVRRHAVLRATFHTVAGPEGDRPQQRIAHRLRLPLRLVDLRALDVEARTATAAALRAADASRPFDLAGGPLIRVTVLRLGAAEHDLLLNLHHIVSDAWSGTILLREVSTLYGGATLPELEIQYPDYAAWQRRLVEERGGLEVEIDWWRQQLADLPPVLDLPLDRPRPSVADSAGQRLDVAFDAELSDSLRQLARDHGSTLFMALLSAWSGLLGRWSGQADFAIGSPVAGRERRELEELVGFFVNTLVLRCRLAPREVSTPSFLDLLARARSTALDAFSHQAVPFERLVEALQPSRQLDVSPLFQVFLVLQNVPAGSVRIPGVVLRRLPQVESSSPFDLSLNLEEREDAAGKLVLAGSVRYRRALFDVTTIRRLLGQLETLLRAVVADPEAPLARLPLLTAAECQQLLEVSVGAPSRGTAAASLVAQIAAQAVARPDAPAVTGALTGADTGADGETWSYRRLAAHAAALARRLRMLDVGRSAGAESGQRAPVAVVLGRSPVEAAALTAVLACGAAYLPLDPAAPPARRAFQLRQAGVRVGLAPASAWPELRALEARGAPVVEWLDPSQVEVGCEVGAGDRVEVEDELVSELVRAPAPHPEQRAYVIYTSGSTGEPKGVEVVHRGLLGLCAWYREHGPGQGLGPGVRVPRVASPAFDASVLDLWPALSAGAELRVVPDDVAPDPEKLRDWLCAEGIAVAHLPTALAVPLLSLPWPAEAPLHTLLTGGDRLPARPPAGLPFRLLNNYGPTENTVLATSGVQSVDGAQSMRVVVPDLGYPLPGVEVHLLDRHDQPVLPGAVGELALGGNSLARGYLARPAQTAERFVPHPFPSESASVATTLPQAGARLYRTGDRARRRADGRLEFLGRSDHQLKLRGYRVEPGEIEALLRSQDGVQDAAVLLQREQDAARLVAYLEAASGQGECQLDAAALRATLLDQLPAYMVPGIYVILESLPRTASGKIDRPALPPPQQDDLSAGAASAASAPPEGELEQRLAELWQELLGLEAVGRDADFFALGGHSLLAVQLLGRVRDEWGVELTLRQLFQAPTLANLATHLAANLAPSMAADPALPTVATEEDPMNALLAELDGLSPEEVEARIRELESELSDLPSEENT